MNKQKKNRFIETDTKGMIVIVEWAGGMGEKGKGNIVNIIPISLYGDR